MNENLCQSCYRIIIGKTKSVNIVNIVPVSKISCITILKHCSGSHKYQILIFVACSLIKYHKCILMSESVSVEVKNIF